MSSKWLFATCSFFSPFVRASTISSVPFWKRGWKVSGRGESEVFPVICTLLIVSSLPHLSSPPSLSSYASSTFVALSRQGHFFSLWWVVLSTLLPEASCTLLLGYMTVLAGKMPDWSRKSSSTKPSFGVVSRSCYDMLAWAALATFASFNFISFSSHVAFDLDTRLAISEALASACNSSMPSGKTSATTSGWN